MKNVYALFAATLMSTVSYGYEQVVAFENPIAYMRQDCEVKGKSGNVHAVGTSSKDLCTNNLGGRYIAAPNMKVAAEMNSDDTAPAH